MTNTSNNDDDREYETTRRMKWICSHAKSIQDMIDALSNEVELLTQLRDRGVVLMGGTATEDDYATLVTTDENVVIDFENCGWGYWEGDPDGDSGMNFIGYTGHSGNFEKYNA